MAFPGVNTRRERHPLLLVHAGILLAFHGIFTPFTVVMTGLKKSATFYQISADFNFNNLYLISNCRIYTYLQEKIHPFLVCVLFSRDMYSARCMSAGEH